MKSMHVLTAAGLTAVGAGIVLGVASQPSIWESWRPATCMPDRCFCEAIRSQLIRQPANSASGLAFAGVALLVLFSGGPDSPGASSSRLNAFASRPAYPLLYAGAALLIGLGTTFYHASLTFWGQTADVLGMYLIATFLALYNLSRLKRLPPATIPILYVGVNALLLAGLILVPGARRFVFAGLILVALLLDIAARRTESASNNARVFKIAVATFAFGFSIWALDITRTLCSPQSWLQGHAVWHVAGATSMWLLFLYLRSATPTGGA